MPPCGFILNHQEALDWLFHFSMEYFLYWVGVEPFSSLNFLLKLAMFRKPHCSETMAMERSLFLKSSRQACSIRISIKN